MGLRSAAGATRNARLVAWERLLLLLGVGAGTAPDNTTLAGIGAATITTLLVRKTAGKARVGGGTGGGTEAVMELEFALLAQNVLQVELGVELALLGCVQKSEGLNGSRLGR